MQESYRISDTELLADISSSATIAGPLPDMNDDKPNNRIDLLPRDPVLQNLCYFARFHGLRIPLTLQVKGLLVSGLLINFREYLKLMNERFRDIVSLSPDDAKRQIFADVADTIFPSDYADGLRIETNDERETAFEKMNFIHLADAIIFAGNQPIPSAGDGIPWRALISSVDSYFTGTLTRET